MSKTPIESDLNNFRARSIICTKLAAIKAKTEKCTLNQLVNLAITEHLSCHFIIDTNGNILSVSTLDGQCLGISDSAQKNLLSNTNIIRGRYIGNNPDKTPIFIIKL